MPMSSKEGQEIDMILILTRRIKSFLNNSLSSYKHAKKQCSVSLLMDEEDTYDLLHHSKVTKIG